ncbi:MAG: carbohydrate ABC transporter permease [Clostridia bacterium]|nr:carbohydrate ABC transporter permease [Clostridia bacterium]
MKKTSSTTGIMNSSDLKLARYKCLYGFFIAFLVIACLISVLPTLWVVLSALKSTQEIYSIPATFFPKKIDVAGVAEVLKDLNITSNIICTFILSVLETLSMILVCGLGGYVFSKLRTKGMGILFMLVVWTMMVPGTMRLVPLYMTFVDFPVFHVSLLNTYIPMCLLAAANSFNVVLFKNFFDSIPGSLVESAQLDGCNRFRIFLSIIIPLSVPAIAFTSITAFNAPWGSYLMPMLVITNEKLQPIPTIIFRLKNSSAMKMNSYMLLLVIATIPPTIVFVFFQKQIMGGINVGAVKG